MTYKTESERIIKHREANTRKQTKYGNTKTGKENRRKAYLKHIYPRLYGITLEDYNTLLIKQNGCCAICGNANNNGRNLNVDHDHITGKVRGLLCTKCNSLLGFSNDSIDILNKAINYLIK